MSKMLTEFRRFPKSEDREKFSKPIIGFEESSRNLKMACTGTSNPNIKKMLCFNTNRTAAFKKLETTTILELVIKSLDLT